MAKAKAQKQYKNKRSVGWRIVFILAIFLLIWSLGIIAYIGISYLMGQNEYNKLADDNFGLVDTGQPATLADFHVDWDALREINPDCVGWVYLPDSTISYPIVWRENDDSYYLYHTFGGGTAGQFAAEFGSIMLAGVNNPEFTDQVNVLYGHHMLDGSMFAMLADFANNSELFNQHRTFFVLTPGGNFRLTSFVVNRVLGSSTAIVIPNFETRLMFTEYIQARLDQTLVEPDPPSPMASEIKQVFAFSTCDAPDDSYRIVTFCYVDEFLPAGSSTSQGAHIVKRDDISDLEGSVGERLS